MKSIHVFGLIVMAVVAKTTAEKIVFCYHGTWSTYRHGNGKFGVENIDPTLCTHLVYTFFGITEGGDFRVLDSYLDLEENWGRGNIRKFNDLKLINPRLKTLAAVGGWNEGSVKYSRVASDPVRRQRFKTTTVQFLLQHGFDGLDVDWEYPGQRGGNPNDKENLVTWLKELRTEFDKHGLLLTAAVGATEKSASISYNIPEISKYLNYINVMAYDLHGSWDHKTGINAPLYEEIGKQTNVHASIAYWLREGAPPHKLVLGIPLYGRSFTLQNSSETGLGSPTYGGGIAGIYTGEMGFLGYNEICEFGRSWTKAWEDSQKVPYAYKGSQWVGYDDERSVEEKVKYALNLNLAGVMVWSVETDDFRGICGKKNPLLRKINEVLGGAVDPSPVPTTSTTSERPTERTTTTTSSRPTEPTRSTEPTTTTSRPTTTSTTTECNSTPSPTTTPRTTTASPEIDCKVDGYYRDPQDCGKFYWCSSGVKYTYRCPGGTFFDLVILACNYPSLVDCSH